jgi:hypothetical protein
MYRTKVQLLVRDSEWSALKKLQTHFRSDNDRAWRKVRDGVHGRIGLRVQEESTQEKLEAILPPGTLRPFDAVIQFSSTASEAERAIEQAVEIAGELSSTVDARGSGILVGTEHIVVPGETPFALVAALRALRSLTSEQFLWHWTHEHAKYGLRVPGLRGYRQVHADPIATRAAAHATGLAVMNFDGIAEADFTSLQDFSLVIASPQVANDARQDEDKFIDHSRSVRGIYKWWAPGNA